VQVLNKQEKNLMCKCKDTKGKSQELGREWVKNGSRIKILMHIICFWMFIIFHECVHRWGTHSSPNLIK
jgi:hypothetical protein